MYLPDEPPRDRRGLLTLVSRIVSGIICLGGFLWASRYFEGNEMFVSIIIMIIPMAMIWYPNEIDDLGKGRYGEGGAAPVVVSIFGWICLLLFLVVVWLKVGRYW